MTSKLFQDRFFGFDARIIRTLSQKVDVIIDNCSAHGTLDSMLLLRSVRFLFHPPNNSSKIQPSVAGVIAFVKMKYGSFQMERAVDLVEEIKDVQNVYRVQTGHTYINESFQ